MRTVTSTSRTKDVAMRFLDVTVQLLTCVNLLLTTAATGLLLRRYRERKISDEKK